MSSFLSRFGGGSNASSRKSSIIDDPNKPVTTEIKTSPTPGYVAKNKPALTEDQEKQVEELKEYAFSLLLPESDPYHPWEKRFLSDPGCMPRYCRAAKWRMQNAKERIKGTIEWRREYKPDLLVPDDIKVEAETGKLILNGFDTEGRPVLYMRPGRENTSKSPRQIQHLVFHLERAIDLAPPGVETVTIVVDYASATSQSNPQLSTARSALNILQNHYVERMGRAVVVNTSWWVNVFFQGIQPFLDPVTKEKIRFNPDNMDEIIPKDQLDSEFGGNNNYKFEKDTYWNSLVNYCHLAPDGGRLDRDGKPTVTALGNGAEHAAKNPQSTPSETARPAETEKNDVGSAGVASNGNAVDDVPASATNDEDQLNAKMVGLSTTEHADGQASFPQASLDNVHPLETAPGPPAGPVVFDHPPSNEEKAEAKEIIAGHHD